MAEIDSSPTEDESGSLRSAPTITVEIYNQTYEISTESDSEYVAQLANFVDRRMREVSPVPSEIDSLRVAILAALDIADELLRKVQPERRAESTELLETLFRYSRHGMRNGMLQARGLWKHRDDLPDFGEIRREWDRLQS